MTPRPDPDELPPGSGPPRPTPRLRRDSSTPRLRRDRVTRFGYGAMAAWGWFLYSFGVLVPLLRDEQGTSRTVSALHSTAMATGGIAAGLVAAAAMRRWRRRGATRVAVGVAAAGTLLLLVGRPTALTLTAAFVCGLGGALMANVAVPVVLDHHGPAGASALSEGNGVAALVALVAPLAVGASVWLGWTWRPALALYPAVLALVLWWLARTPRPTPALDGDRTVIAPPAPAASEVQGFTAPRGRRSPRLPGVYWATVLALNLCIGVEFVTATWGADLVRLGTGASAAAATAMISTVVAGIAVGRFALGPLALRYPPRPLLAGSFAVTVIGWLTVWCAPTTGRAIVGLAVMGLGIAAHYPLLITLCVAAAPGRTDEAIGYAGAAASSASGGAPFVLAALADATDIRTAFLAVPAMIAAAGLTVLAAARAAHHPRNPARATRPPSDGHEPGPAPTRP